MIQEIFGISIILSYLTTIQPANIAILLTSLSILFGYWYIKCTRKIFYVSSATDDKLANAIKDKLSMNIKWRLTNIMGVNSGVGRGFFITRDWSVCGWMSHEMSATNQSNTFTFTIYMFCSDEVKTELEEPSEKNPFNVKVYNYDGSKPFGQTIILANSNSSPIIVSPQQTCIVDALCKDVEVGAGALIVGPPGTGKTHIAELVAKHLVKMNMSPSIVYGFDPTIKGANFEIILNKTKPGSKTPLVIAFDEFDDIIFKAHSRLRSEYHNILVCDKPSLGRFLDRLGKMPNVIYIATSNESLKWFADDDREYVTRNGRFSHKFELNGLTTEEAQDCFMDACKKYGISAKSPDFSMITKPITIAKMADAFKRSHGDIDKLLSNLKFK